MKKQNENGRIPEDRLSRANKRKKNNTIASILVMTGCLLVLVLVTYVAGILYSWIDSKFQNNANDLAAAAEAGSQTEESTQEVVKTYTQEEVDALIAEAKQQAEDEEENKILSGIRDGLTSGTTMVETLRPYYPNELVVVSNGTFNFVPIRDDLQKNDLQKKRPKMQIKKSAVAIAHPSFSVYNLGGRNVSFQNGSGTQTIFRSRTGNL